MQRNDVRQDELRADIGGLRAVAVRYQVTDVDRALEFYTGALGFRVVQRRGPVAIIAIDGVRLWLSGPGSSGSRPLPGGRAQEPGGANRLVLEAADLPTLIATLQRRDVTFRNTIEVGPGGSQVQVQDPDGNPIELFEPAATLA